MQTKVTRKLGFLIALLVITAICLLSIVRSKIPKADEFNVTSGTDTSGIESTDGYSEDATQILVVANDENLIRNDDNLVSSYDDLYLLEYDTPAEAEEAVEYYNSVATMAEMNDEFEIDDSITEVTSEDTTSEEEVTSEEITSENNTSEEITSEDTEATTEDTSADVDSTDEADSLTILSEIIDDDVDGTGTIAIIDTGVNADVYESISVIGDDASDDNGHGTRMYEIIKEEYPEAKILSIKAMNANGKGSAADIYAALEYAIEKNVSIINLSLSAYATEGNAIIEEEINKAIDAGIIVVGAAGNKAMDVQNFIPGKIERAIIVGAIDSSGNPLTNSNYGSTLDYFTYGNSSSEATARLTGIIARVGIDKLAECSDVFSNSHNGIGNEASPSDAEWDASPSDASEKMAEEYQYSDESIDFSTVEWFDPPSEFEVSSTAFDNAPASIDVTYTLTGGISSWSGYHTNIWLNTPSGIQMFTRGTYLNGTVTYVRGLEGTSYHYLDGRSSIFCTEYTKATPTAYTNTVTLYKTYDSGNGIVCYTRGGVTNLSSSYQTVGIMAYVQNSSCGYITLNKEELNDTDKYSPSFDGIEYWFQDRNGVKLAIFTLDDYGKTKKIELLSDTDIVLNDGQITLHHDPISMRPTNVDNDDADEELFLKISFEGIDYLWQNAFEFVEKTTNSNYVLNATITETPQVNQNEIKSVLVGDKETEKFGAIQVLKVNQDGEPVSGAEYTLYKNGVAYADASGVSSKVTSSADYNKGLVTFYGLSAGTYTIEETAPPAGFTKDDTTYTIKIDTSKTVAEWSYVYDDTSYLTHVTHKDSSGNRILSDITNSDGSYIFTWGNNRITELEAIHFWMGNADTIWDDSGNLLSNADDILTADITSRIRHAFIVGGYTDVFTYNGVRMTRGTTATFNPVSYTARYGDGFKSYLISSGMSEADAEANAYSYIFGAKHYQHNGASENRKTLSDAEYAALGVGTVTGNSTGLVIVKSQDIEGGYLDLYKVSNEPSVDYTLCPLTGAQFTLYTDAACTNVAKDINGDNVVFETTRFDATNKRAYGAYKTEGNKVRIPVGTYYLKETRSPSNYKGMQHAKFWNPSTNAYDLSVATVKIINNGTDTTATVWCQNEVAKGSFEVYKYSDQPSVTNTNTCYSLAGAQFTLYTDENFSNVAKDVYGNSITVTTVEKTDSNGIKYGYAYYDNIPLGTYYLKETKAPKGFKANALFDTNGNGVYDQTKGTVVISANNTTTNRYKIGAQNKAAVDPVYVLLKKKNANNEYLAGGQYTFEYYESVQSTDVATIRAQGTKKATWVLQTSDGSNDIPRGWLRLNNDCKVSGPDFYYDDRGVVGFPLGSVIFYESKAPDGYQIAKNDDGSQKIYTLKIYQDTNGDIWAEGDMVARDFNDPDKVTQSKEQTKYVDLTIKKDVTIPTSYQGNMGDVSLEGAVFALYAKRDVVDVAAGITRVDASEVYTERTALKTESGTPVLDYNGNQVYAEVGDKKPVVILDPTDAEGYTKTEGLYCAVNADDYYYVELSAPQGFYRISTPQTVDLRDNTDHTDYTVERISYEYKAWEQPVLQPLRVAKFELVQENKNVTPTLDTVNGVKFHVYLISDLQHLDTAKKIVNADGSIKYDFDDYDFSDETPIIVRDDATGDNTELVTGADGEDGLVESIPLFMGDYVLVEFEHPSNLEPVDPVVIHMPKYKMDENGIELDEFDDPEIFIANDANVLNVPVEKYLKINKKDALTDEFVLNNSAKFTIWDVSDLTDDERSNRDTIKEKGTQYSQWKQTPYGFEEQTEFYTNEEGFLVIFDKFGYGEYAIVEEGEDGQGPIGYDVAEPVVVRVRSDAVYLLSDGDWYEMSVWHDTLDNEYWEAVVEDQPFTLEVSKVDSETGKWVSDAELTVFKAVDEEGNLAIDEEGNPVILEARDESGEFVQAVWTTTPAKKRFEVVPAGWYVLRETATPDGYATRKDVIIYVGNSSEVSTDGERSISGEDTIYYAFNEVEDGVEFEDVSELDSLTIKTKNVEIAVPNKPLTVDVSKIDVSTEGELPGAELTVYDENGEVIDTWISTDTPHRIKYLKKGKYTLHENTIPLGFYAQPNTIEFEIVDTESIQKCTMVNHPIVVDFYKESLDASCPVEGATLAVYRKSEGPWGTEEKMAKALEENEAYYEKASETDATETDVNEDAEGLVFVERWVSTTEPHSIVGLYPGEYRLVEEKTPFGYTTSDYVDFTITDQGPAEPVHMYDEEIHCFLEVTKTGEVITSTELTECEYGTYNKFVWEDTTLKDVSFDVFDEDGKLVEVITTDETGIARTGELPFGEYKVKEHVPAGFVDDNVVYTVKYTWLYGMKETTITGKLSVHNDSCNTQVNIWKIGEDVTWEDGKYVYKKKPLGGVLFGVYAEENVYNYSGELLAPKDTCVGYAVTDEAGVATLNEKLLKGKYYYKELKTAGPEYVPDESVHSFELILANSKIDTFNLNEFFPIENNRVKGKLRIVKIDADGKVPLAGAEFDMFNSDDVLIGHLVTDANGLAETEELPYGSYYLKETKAPEGYQSTDTKFEAKIVHNNEITVITIENAKTPKLGTKDVALIAFLSAVLAGLLVAIIKMLKRA